MGTGNALQATPEKEVDVHILSQDRAPTHYVLNVCEVSLRIHTLLQNLCMHLQSKHPSMVKHHTHIHATVGTVHEAAIEMD